jgi:hypothetical protein
MAQVNLDKRKEQIVLLIELFSARERDRERQRVCVRER